jgi:serine phosphatase RsbU (regulator of sigma subunit)
VPLLLRSSPGKAFGVIQLDTQARHKKFNQEDLRLLMAVASQASIALENARMQKSFLPKAPPQVAGYEFFAHYESAQEVGGDCYDFITLPGGKCAVTVGDVAGKGVPAALLMAKVTSDARISLLTTTTLGDAVYRLNEAMQEAGQLDRFVTLIACLVDPAAHTVTFVNAGHLPPLLYRRASGQIEEAMSRELAGFPLGIADGIPYEAAAVALEPGDFVTLFTDGVSEAKNRAGADFDIKGALRAIEAGPTFTAKDAGARIVAAVRQHSQGTKQHDDITVVCFGRTA